MRVEVYCFIEYLLYWGEREIRVLVFGYILVGLVFFFLSGCGDLVFYFVDIRGRGRVEC